MMKPWKFPAALAAGIAPALLLAQPQPGDAGARVARLIEDRDGLRDVPFPEVIAAATGWRILPIDSKRDAGMLRSLGAALDAALRVLNDPEHPMHAVSRVNEMSRFVEDEIRAQINRIEGWTCGIPETSAGGEQRPGYPDLRIVTDAGLVIYLDPKIYAPEHRDGTLRTFYYEPKSATNKVHEDAHHLLAGIRHNGGDGRALRLDRWELIDLSKLTVQLKAEFQAGNRDLYRDEMIILASPGAGQ
jgi:hypothetical protein